MAIKDSYDGSLMIERSADDGGDDEGVITVGAFEQEEFVFQLDQSRLPDMLEIERHFPGAANVSGIFDGRAFEQHPTRAGMERLSGQRVFMVKCFPEDIELEEAINQVMGFGWRPANEKGAYHFALANPDYHNPDIVPKRPNWVLAPGAWTAGACHILIPALSFGPGWRSLGSRSRYNPVPPSMGLLFERL